MGGQDNKYKARVIIQHNTGQDLVAVNSWHRTIADAKQSDRSCHDSLNGIGGAPRLQHLRRDNRAAHGDIAPVPPVDVAEVLGHLVDAGKPTPRARA